MGSPPVPGWTIERFAFVSRMMIILDSGPSSTREPFASPARKRGEEKKVSRKDAKEEEGRREGRRRHGLSSPLYLLSSLLPLRRSLRSF